MKATSHLFEGSKLRGMDLGPNLRALIRILRPFNWHLVYGDEAAISECSGESALLVCSFVPLAIPHPVSSAGVLAPSSLALPVPETKQKPLSLDTGSPPQARTAFAFLGGPVCSLMASAKAPPTPPPVPTVLVSSQGTHSPVGATWTVDLSLGSVHCTYPDSVCWHPHSSFRVFVACSCIQMPNSDQKSAILISVLSRSLCDPLNSLSMRYSNEECIAVF